MIRQTKVTKKIGHDSMVIKAVFPSGANLKFSVGRSGEKLELAFSNDRNELKRQSKIFSKFIEFKKDETNADRFDRIEKICYKFRSGNELIKAIS